MSASDCAVKKKKNKTYISNRKKHSARRGETNSSKQIFSIQGSVCLQESCFLLESEFRGSEFLESEFRCLVVLWKMNWKTLSSVWLCYGKETEK